jgi:quercetin dioxygenase-like cupin family protein
MRASIIIAVIAVAAFLAHVSALAEEKGAPGSVAQHEVRGAVATQHALLTPADVKWGQPPPVLPPGAQFALVEGDPKAAGQLVSFRLKMPDGYRIPPHFHPADEHVVVLQGTFNVGLGDELDEKASKPLGAGSFAIMPKGEHHYAWAKGETVVQVYAIGPWGLIYVNPADDPRKAKM